MQTPSRRIYDRNFVKNLRIEIQKLHAVFPDLGPADLEGVESVYDFDDRYTAPRHGFAGADDYYARSSAGPLISKICVPGLVVHAEDDPFIPVGIVPGVGVSGGFGTGNESLRWSSRLYQPDPVGRRSTLARFPAQLLAGRPLGDGPSQPRRRV